MSVDELDIGNPLDLPESLHVGTQESRWEILDVLPTDPKDAMSAREVAETLSSRENGIDADVTEQWVMYHVKKLQKAGLVRTFIDPEGPGRSVYTLKSFSVNVKFDEGGPSIAGYNE